MWKSYSELEKRLGTQGQELGNYKQAYEQLGTKATEYEKAVRAWDAWYKSDIAPNMEDFQAFLKTKQGKQAAQALTGQSNQQAATQQVQEWMQGWDGMTPQQQANALYQASLQQIASSLAPALQNWQKQFTEKFQRDVAEKEQYFNNYLNLYRRVMDMRMQNPNLDVDQVLDQAVKVLSGQQDPIELGKTLATLTSDRDAAIKEAVEKARKDWETEQQNKNLATVRPTAGNPPAFKLPSAGSSKRGLASMREDVAKQILEKHGSGVFQQLPNE
jgi:uncharacterized protein YukE